MKKQEIFDRLCAKGFDEQSSEILAENLATMSPRLQERLDTWLKTGEESDFESHGMSIQRLMEENDMQYQAALLTMDWILKEPDQALQALDRGIR